MIVDLTAVVEGTGQARLLDLSGFWRILERIAAAEGSTVTRLLTTLHDEVLARRGAIGNFASLLRVTCLHWLENQDHHAAEVAARSREAA